MRPASIWTALTVAIALVVVVAVAIVLVFNLTDTGFILGLLSVAAAIIVAAMQYRTAKDNETESRLFSQKQAVYSDLIDQIMRVFHEKKTSSTPAQQEALVKKLRSIRTQLIIWGSSETILSLDKLEFIAPDTSGMPTKGIKWMAELFAAIRKDLGHKDPDDAALEIALGILKGPDRSSLRDAIMKAGN